MPKLFNKQDRKGFTLIEVLVVSLIVGVLASILLATYQKYILKSRAAEAINLLEIVKKRQHIARAKSKSRTFITNVSDIVPLTSRPNEVLAGDSLIINNNYILTLNEQNQCAVVSYKQQNQERFKFAISYVKAGLGCQGDICSSFGETISDISSVCSTEDTPICTYQNCDLGQTWSSEACSCVQCTSCAPGYHFSGVGCECVSDGTPIVLECQSPRVLVNGNCVCPSCTGGQVLTGNNCTCSCPLNKPYWDGMNCIACDSPKVWQNKQCVCPACSGGQVITDEKNCTCSCPSEKPYWDGNECIECKSPRQWINGECIACESPRQWIDGECKCPGEKHWDGKKCVSCAPPRPIWNEQTKKCVSCYSYHGADAPVWDSNTSRCVSCYTANPPKVICSSGGSGTPGMGSIIEYPLTEGKAVDSPRMKFSDYLNEYNAKNIDSYALKSGALVAVAELPVSYCTGAVSTVQQYINTTPQCSAQGQTAPCQYNCVPMLGNIVGIEDPCGATISNGGMGVCSCDAQLGRWVCPTDCDILQSGFYDVQESPPNCTPSSIVTCQSQIQNLGTQGDCSATWHGAASYVPAKPRWVVNSSLSAGGYCDSCGGVSVTSCSQSSQDCGITRDTFSGSVWNGSSCVTLNSYTIYDNKCMTFGVRPVIKCNTQYTSTGAVYCNEAYYWGCDEDDTNNTCHGYNCRRKTAAAPNIRTLLGSCESFRQVFHGPYNKAYYAVSKLGISEGLIGDVITE